MHGKGGMECAPASTHTNLNIDCKMLVHPWMDDGMGIRMISLPPLPVRPCPISTSILSRRVGMHVLSLRARCKKSGGMTVRPLGTEIITGSHVVAVGALECALVWPFLSVIKSKRVP